MTTCQELDNESEQIVYQKQAHLRDCGWKQSSSHPGAYWLWSKELVPCSGGVPGGDAPRMYHLPFEMAWTLQRQSEALSDVDGDDG